MHIHFIIHETFEAPGAYETWAKQRGHSISFTRVYSREALPQDVQNIDFLIVMGGPQSPSTTLDECPHFDAHAEQELILKVINAQKVVLGICLGSQLIGEALGAQYDHSPEKEIGKFPITLTEAGLSHSLFSHFGPTLAVSHWHNDMPGLTPDAEVIAFSEGCPRQIVAYRDCVFGLQCHMELTKEVVELLIENDDFSDREQHRFVESPETLLNHDYEEMNQVLFTFLDKLELLYLNTK